jgi:hypothetical protein
VSSGSVSAFWTTTMRETVSFKRLILRAVLRQVSPMVIRLVSVSDHMPLPEFHDVFRIILGWNGDLGYIIRVHGQEFNSFRRKIVCWSASGVVTFSNSTVPITIFSRRIAARRSIT